MLALAQHANALVHESTFGKDESQLAFSYYHSTNIQAAKVAQKAQVGKLFLTHISARYVGLKSLQLEKDARTVFKQTTLANDFDTFFIPFSRK